MPSQGSQQPGAAPSNPPSASSNTVKISFKTAQLQRRGLNLKTGWLGAQPVHLTRLIAGQCVPFWGHISQTCPYPNMHPHQRASQWVTLNLPQATSSWAASQACCLLHNTGKSHQTGLGRCSTTASPRPASTSCYL